MFLIKRCSPCSPFLINLASTITVIRNNHGDKFEKPDELLANSQATENKSVEKNTHLEEDKIAKKEKKVNIVRILHDVKLKKQSKERNPYKQKFVELVEEVSAEFENSSKIQEDLMNFYSKSSFKDFNASDKRKLKSSEFKLSRMSLKNTPASNQQERLNFNNLNRVCEFFDADKLITKENECSAFWEELEQKKLNYLSKAPPRNYFDEMIMWTNEGKLWHFPIDNDQGRFEEATIHFTEHIFLDSHLEPWCPKAGPLRHFMELVLVGLSKNPYLSVEDKKEHIEWFKGYFENKKKVLTEVGAFSSKSLLKEAEQEIEEKNAK